MSMVKGYKLSVTRLISLRDVTYSMINIVNNIIYLKIAHHKRTHILTIKNKNNIYVR